MILPRCASSRRLSHNAGTDRSVFLCSRDYADSCETANTERNVHASVRRCRERGVIV